MSEVLYHPVTGEAIGLLDAVGDLVAYASGDKLHQITADLEALKRRSTFSSDGRGNDARKSDQRPWLQDMTPDEAGEVIHRLAQDRVEQHGSDYAEAVDAIMQGHPQLAAVYNDQPAVYVDATGGADDLPVGSDPGDAEPYDGDVETEIDRLAQERLDQHDDDYSRAVDAVLADRGDLREAYRRLTGPAR